MRGHDTTKGMSKTTSYINKLFDTIKTLVVFKHLSHGKSTVVEHSFVEYFVKPWISSKIIKRSYAISHVHWDSSLYQCIFNFAPWSTHDTVRNKRQQRAKANRIFVSHKQL
uniref:Uncharacterized protein n=1 Tax=Opuntia streptacantha TaxID=393608 RepID=A0A7C9DF29_OPUST